MNEKKSPIGEIGNQYAKGCTTSGREKIYTIEFIEKEAQALEKWILKEDSLHFAGFTFPRGYSMKLLNEFAKESPVFSAAYSRVKEIQQAKVVNLSLQGKYNANFAKFYMSNCHGWRDKTEISGDPNAPLKGLLELVSDKSQGLVETDLEPPKTIDIKAGDETA